MKDDRFNLAQIRDAIERIQSYTTDGIERFLADSMVQDAVIRNLEVIGEAVKGLSEITRAKSPNIPWPQIAGMRDVLIHNYFGVKLDIVWQVVIEHLPPLHEAVCKLLESERG